jgi:transposase
MKQFDAVRLILTTTLSDREVAASVGISKTTVGRYRRLAQAKKLTWAKVSTLDPAGIHQLFNRAARGGKEKNTPDLAVLHDQLQGKSMTLQLLWEDYRRDDPDRALSYSHLAAKLKVYRARLPSVMRQHHRPGERAFVDYSGLRPHYLDPTTRQKVMVELFIGVLPASSLMFAVCSPSQKVPDFVGAHVAMLNYFGGVPEVLVPDNLKSAVVTAGKTPTLQKTYADFARHYGIAVLPARPYRPRDKASVEGSVKFAQQRILSRLRHQHFYSLDELNIEIAKLLEEANARPMVKDGISRRDRFEALERAALKPLPAQPYVYAEWVPVPKVPQDYHVCVDGHFYSVPHALIGQKLDARVTDTMVELTHQRRIVARHARSVLLGRHTTDPAHQPEAHRAHAERSPTGMLTWAKTAGPNVLRFVQHQLDRAQPFHGLPACDTVRGLAHTHGTLVVDRAARSALDLRSPTVTTLRRVLDNAAQATKAPAAPRSSNARGPRGYLEATPC